jgi:GNAT superfamily N-acetyltransferase
MPYQLIEHCDPRAFHDVVIDHLLHREAECCAQIGLVDRMARNGYSPISVDELDRPLLWTIQDGSRIELVAIQTLKTAMILTDALPSAMEFFAEALASRQWIGNSLIGVTPSINSLVHMYAALTQRHPTLVVRLRVFQLDRVIWPTPVRGSMRLAKSEDREVLARFLTGFLAAIGEPFDETTIERADRLIADRRIFFWDDPEPVAMAGWAGPTPNGVRVNSVYTDPNFRGRGYASNLVAHLSQHLLEHRRKYCFLFTDQANPTSNSIYQKIGYRPVSDSERWQFH